MDIQTRKLNLISYLAQLEDEGFIGKIEAYILKKRHKKQEDNFVPLTAEELVSRIEKSAQDFQAGKFKIQDELEKISEKW